MYCEISTTAVQSTMRSQACLLLLAVCCLWAAQGQSDHIKKGIWDEPIRFHTKAKDACTMRVTDQGGYTKLRVSCRNQNTSYWCDFQGRPNACHSYNRNPKHYFTQIMWDMRKLHNACQGPRVLRPIMCLKASDEAQMVYASSWRKPAPGMPTDGAYEKPMAQMKETTARPAAEKRSPQKTQPKSSTPKPGRMTIPTAPSVVLMAWMAQDYCFKSLQGVNTIFMSWFHN